MLDRGTAPRNRSPMPQMHFLCTMRTPTMILRMPTSTTMTSATGMRHFSSWTRGNTVQTSRPKILLPILCSVTSSSQRCTTGSARYAYILILHKSLNTCFNPGEPNCGLQIHCDFGPLHVPLDARRAHGLVGGLPRREGGAPRRATLGAECNPPLWRPPRVCSGRVRERG